MFRACVLLAMLLALPCLGAAAAESDAEGGAARLPEDRAAQAVLVASAERLQRGEHAEVIGVLGRLLTAEPEGFVIINGTHRTVHAEANRLLGLLPPSALKLYEQQFGARAAQALAEAQRAADLDRLREIAVRYRFTSSGLTAWQQLAEWHFDLGEFTAAAAVSRQIQSHPLATREMRQLAELRRLVAQARAGDVEAARQQAQRFANLTIRLGGQSVRAVDWLERELRRSDAKPAARPVTASLPSLIPVWKQETPLGLAASAAEAKRDRKLPVLRPDLLSGLTQPLPLADVESADDLRSALQRRRRELRDYGIPHLPSFQPLVVDEVLVTRTLEALGAWNVRTGQPLWREPTPSLAGVAQNANRVRNDPFRRLLADQLTRRIEADSIYGRLTTDGRQVFAIEEDSLPLTEPMLTPMPTGHPSQDSAASASPHNQLMAYEVRTGKLLWRAGGPLADVADQLSGQFFLGPPLVEGDRLYVVGQRGTELRLLALRRATGELDWSLPLAEVSKPLSAEPDRRLWACPLLSAGGLLICPTTAGLIVAVDPTTRTSTWAQRYSIAPRGPRHRSPEAMRQPTAPPEHWWQGWREVSLLTDGTRVIAASPESDLLHAFDAQTGDRLWSRPRGDGLLLAGMTRDAVLVVRRHQVEAVALDDGTVRWTADTGAAAGRGVLNSTHLFLPLVSGSVAAITLADGQWQRTYPPASGARFVGNLTACPEGCVAQNTDRLALLPSLDEQRQRALPGGDTAHLLAQVRRDREAGDFATAAEWLRKLDANDAAVKRELRQTLLAWLRQQPPNWKTLAAELKPLAESPRDRAATLYALANAARHSGEFVPALEAYFDLLALDLDEFVTAAQVPPRRVRFDRQVEGELRDLLAAATAEQRRDLEAAFARRLEQVRKSPDPFAVQRFAERLSGLPWGRQLRLDRTRETGIGWSPLRRELALLDIAGSSDRTLAAQALPRLIEQMLDHSFPEAALRYAQQARRDFGDVFLKDGQMVASRLNTWPADAPLLTRTSRPPDPWPRRIPEVSSEKEQNDDVYFYPVPVEASPGSLVSRLDVLIERQTRSIRFAGGGQRGSWEVSLPSNKSPLRFVYNLCHGWGVGSLLIVRAGSELFAIAPLDDHGEPNARILWSLDTSGGTPLRELPASVPVPAIPGFREANSRMVGVHDRVVAQVGPVRAGYLCYQEKAKLVCVETATGQRLWERWDLPTGITVSGDDETVLLHNPTTNELELLHALDGKPLGTVAAPTPKSVLRQSGRHALMESRAESYQLRRVDLTSGAPVWERAFPNGSRSFAMDSETVGVVQPDGALQIIDEPTGKTRVTTRVRLPKQLTRIVCAADERWWYVAFSDEVRDEPRLKALQFQGGYRTPLVNGVLHALDRETGEVLWQRPLENEPFAMDVSKMAPILVRVFRPVNPARRDSTNPLDHLECHVRCFDKRTGEEILRRDELVPHLYHALECDAEQGRVVVKLERLTIRLDYAPELLPADAEHPANVPAEPDTHSADE